LNALKKKWDESGDPDAVAIFQYPPEVFQQIQRAEKLALSIDKLLVSYGLRGVEPSVINLPWSEEVGPKRAAVQAALSIMSREESALRETMQTIKESRSADVLPPALQAIANRIANSAGGLSMSTSDWMDVINRAAAFNLREALGLNSSKYYISLGILASNELEPNNPLMPKYLGLPNTGLALIKDDERRRARRLVGEPLCPIVFRIGRPTDHDVRGKSSLDTFYQYWSTVLSENLFSDDDIKFLKMMSEYDDVERDWHQVAVSLVSNLSQAKSSLAVSQQVDRVIQEFSLASIPDWRVFDQQLAQALRNADPKLDDPTIGLLIHTIGIARDKGDGGTARGRPSSTDAAAYFVADQMRPQRQFFWDDLVCLQESRGVIESTGRIKYKLLDSAVIPTISLPLEGNDPLWWRNRLTPDNPDEEINNPFIPLIWQAMMTLSPSVNAIVSQHYGEQRADEIYRVGLLVSSLSSDLTAKLWQAAGPLREYARQLLKQSDEDLINLRFGHFIVAEPAIVEASAVSNGDSAKAGDALGIVRPIFRYNVEFELEPSSALSKRLFLAMPATLMLSCNAPMPISTDQKGAILADPRKTQIMQWLATLRSRYLGATNFNTKIVSIERLANYPSASGVRRNLVRLAFEVPERARYIDTSLAANNEAGSSEALQKLLTLGFEKKQDNTGHSFLKLPMGPFGVGEQCSGRLSFNTQN
jgi:hypothetical protein